MDEQKVVLETTRVVNDIIKIRGKSSEEVKNGLYDILTQSSEVFDIISKYQKEFIKDELRSLDFYHQTLDQLTGCYMYLSPIVAVLDALEKNRSLNYYHTMKIEIEKSGTKFVSASAERDSDNFVVEERYILAIFSGYADACRTGIQTCRNRIKEQHEELDLS